MFLFRKSCLVLTPSGTQRDQFVCSVALSFLERLIGFYWGATVQAIFFPRCRMLHSVGLRHTLQVLFLDCNGVVLVVVDQFKPWQRLGCQGAAHAIELISPVSVAIGDRIVFEKISVTHR